MTSIVLLILIINNSAAVYETHGMQQCQEIREYALTNLAKQYKKGTFAAECFYKLGGQSKETKYRNL